MKKKLLKASDTWADVGEFHLWAYIVRPHFRMATQKPPVRPSGARSYPSWRRLVVTDGQRGRSSDISPSVPLLKRAFPSFCSHPRKHIVRVGVNLSVKDWPRVVVICLQNHNSKVSLVRGHLIWYLSYLRVSFLKYQFFKKFFEFLRNSREMLQFAKSVKKDKK